MTPLRIFAWLILAGGAIQASPALGHVTLETQQAVAGSTYKAVLRVLHGCNGSPTLAIRVRIPDDALGARPQPKPGWTVETVKEKLAQPYKDIDGRLVTEAVREIRWRGGPLLDEHYDEFVFRVRLPDKPGEIMYFPTVQECQEGIHRWIEVPGPKTSRREHREPAPQLKLLPKAR